jgi:hypothetical protein
MNPNIKHGGYLAFLVSWEVTLRTMEFVLQTAIQTLHVWLFFLAWKCKNCLLKLLFMHDRK